MREIREHKIQLYEFPECEDEEENRLNKKLKVSLGSVHFFDTSEERRLVFRF